MKKYSIIKFLMVLSLVFSIQSCRDLNDLEFPEAKDPGSLAWQATTHMKISPTEGKETFVWLTNIITLEQYWGNDTVELNFEMDSSIPTENFSKIDFYLTVEEKDGYNSTPPYNTEGKLLRTITDLPENANFVLQISGNKVYEMFKSDFINPRQQAPLLDGDLFEIHWIITNKDGTFLNSQDYIQGEYRFGFSTLHKDKKPPSWEGTFNYEWTYVSDGGLQWGGVKVGDTGQIEIVETTEALELNKEFDVSHLLFNYNYGGDGKIFLNYTTGETYVEGGSEEKWTISNVDGNTLEIAWTYKYSAEYDEYGTVRLTRTDGEDWPENFHSPSAFPWGGKFDYEWIAATDDAINYGGIQIGDTGETNISDGASEGLYNVDHLIFGYKYGGAGTLTYDAVSGLTSVQGSEEEKWIISNVTATTLDISWEYEWSASYNEYGTVRLTRKDGKVWPENINTD
ncbi:MAG: hypothetical protein L3J34_06315 [Flavobacteriaceae bacterium]|nr:hypothetical protein [Flavobacteriaceae bacterium]